MRTRFSFLNQNFPFDVIFSESMVRFFSCMKSLFIDVVFCDAAENASLNFERSLTAAYPGYCARARIPHSINTAKKKALCIWTQVKHFIQPSYGEAFSFNNADEFR